MTHNCPTCTRFAAMHRRAQKAEGELSRLKRWVHMVRQAGEAAGPAYLLHETVGSPEKMDARGNPTPSRKALALVIGLRFLAMSWRPENGHRWTKETPNGR